MLSLFLAPRAEKTTSYIKEVNTRPNRPIIFYLAPARRVPEPEVSCLMTARDIGTIGDMEDDLLEDWLF
ncbi:MAG: hypothetical protein JNL72_04065 [Flavipsychrobacter sp.]|nr:hypothetical protein [Flavipsychrobacter sp.]